MSTRSRRSGAGQNSSENVLNPATIPFLEKSRLTKELELRGLPTSGNKNALADRLYEFVVNGGGIPISSSQENSVKTENLTASPATPSTTRGRKGKQKEASVEIQSVSVTTENTTEKTRNSKRKTRASVGEVKEEPVEDEAVAVTPAPAKRGRTNSKLKAADDVSQPQVDETPKQTSGKKVSPSVQSNKRVSTRRSVVSTTEEQAVEEPAPKRASRRSTATRTPTPQSEPQPSMDEPAPVSEVIDVQVKEELVENSEETTAPSLSRPTRSRRRTNRSAVAQVEAAQATAPTEPEQPTLEASVAAPPKRVVRKSTRASAGAELPPSIVQIVSETSTKETEEINSASDDDVPLSALVSQEKLQVQNEEVHVQEVSTTEDMNFADMPVLTQEDGPEPDTVAEDDVCIQEVVVAQDTQEEPGLIEWEDEEQPQVPEEFGRSRRVRRPRIIATPPPEPPRRRRSNTNRAAAETESVVPSPCQDLQEDSIPTDELSVASVVPNEKATDEPAIPIVTFMADAPELVVEKQDTYETVPAASAVPKEDESDVRDVKRDDSEESSKSEKSSDRATAGRVHKHRKSSRESRDTAERSNQLERCVERTTKRRPSQSQAHSERTCASTSDRRTSVDRPRPAPPQNVGVGVMWQKRLNEFKRQKEQEKQHVEKMSTSADAEASTSKVAGNAPLMTSDQEPRAKRVSFSAVVPPSTSASGSSKTAQNNADVLNSILDEQQSFLESCQRKPRSQETPLTPNKRRQRREEKARQAALSEEQVRMQLLMPRILSPSEAPPPPPPDADPLAALLVPPPPPTASIHVVPPAFHRSPIDVVRHHVPPAAAPGPARRLSISSPQQQGKPAARDQSRPTPTSAVPPSASASVGRSSAASPIVQQQSQKPQAAFSKLPPPPPPPKKPNPSSLPVSTIPSSVVYQHLMTKLPPPPPPPKKVPVAQQQPQQNGVAIAGAGMSPQNDSTRKTSSTAPTSQCDTVFLVMKALRDKKDVEDCVCDVIGRVSNEVFKSEVATEEKPDPESVVHAAMDDEVKELALPTSALNQADAELHNFANSEEIEEIFEPDSVQQEALDAVSDPTMSRSFEEEHRIAVDEMMESNLVPGEEEAGKEENDVTTVHSTEAEAVEVTTSEEKGEEEEDQRLEIADPDLYEKNGSPEPESGIMEIDNEKSPESSSGDKENACKMTIDAAILVKRANDVLSNWRGKPNNVKSEKYSQVDPEPDVEVIEPEKTLPEFHGEPVPSDDDDALFEAAAGIPVQKRSAKKRKEIVIEEEVLPTDAYLQLDYYNGDLHIKAVDDKQWWIVQPDNGDGFALSWGGCRTTYGIPLPYHHPFPREAPAMPLALIDLKKEVDEEAAKKKRKPFMRRKEEREEKERKEEEERAKLDAQNSADKDSADGGEVSMEHENQPSTSDGRTVSSPAGSPGEQGLVERVKSVVLDDDIVEAMDHDGKQEESDERTVELEDTAASLPPKARKLAFQIKILEHLSLKHIPFEEDEPHSVRIGFSLGSSPTVLGEYDGQWCVSSSGKKSSANIFTEWGREFGIGDVCTAVLDLDAREIEYWLNGECMGVAFRNIKLSDGDVLFPHVNVKNCKVAVNLGFYPEEKEEWNASQPDWTFPMHLGLRTLVPTKRPPESKEMCTVLLMVGMTGVGKTTWVRRYLKEHPAEHWTVINAENLLNQMRVNGMSRQRTYRGRWDIMMGVAGKTVTRALNLACRRRRNYIIDGTHVNRDSRKRKLTPFKDFTRTCVCIVPTEEEWHSRQLRQSRQDGGAIPPPDVILEMKATISIPNQELEPFERLVFVEPVEDKIQDAIELIAKFNEEGRPWLQRHQKGRRRGMRGAMRYTGDRDQNALRQQLGEALSFDASSRRNSADLSPTSSAATGANAIGLNSPSTPVSSAQHSPAFNAITSTSGQLTPGMSTLASFPRFMSRSGSIPTVTVTVTSVAAPASSAPVTGTSQAVTSASQVQDVDTHVSSPSISSPAGPSAPYKSVMPESSMRATQSTSTSLAASAGLLTYRPHPSAVPPVPILSQPPPVIPAHIPLLTPLQSLIAPLTIQTSAPPPSMLQHPPPPMFSASVPPPPFPSLQFSYPPPMSVQPVYSAPMFTPRPVSPTADNVFAASAALAAKAAVEAAQRQATEAAANYAASLVTTTAEALPLIAMEVAEAPAEPSPAEVEAPPVVVGPSATTTIPTATSSDDVEENSSPDLEASTSLTAEETTIVGAPVRYPIQIKMPSGIPRSQLAAQQKAKEEARMHGAQQQPSPVMIGPVLPAHLSKKLEEKRQQVSPIPTVAQKSPAPVAASVPASASNSATAQQFVSRPSTSTTPDVQQYSSPIPPQVFTPTQQSPVLAPPQAPSYPQQSPVSVSAQAPTYPQQVMMQQQPQLQMQQQVQQQVWYQQPPPTVQQYHSSVPQSPVVQQGIHHSFSVPNMPVNAYSTPPPMQFPPPSFGQSPYSQPPPQFSMSQPPPLASPVQSATPQQTQFPGGVPFDFTQPPPTWGGPTGYM